MSETRQDRPEPRPAGARPSRIRIGSVFVRAAHLLAVSAVAGAVLLDVGTTGTHAWWAAAGVTGVLLLVAELLLHAELFRDVCGWATILKLVLIASLVATPATAAPWLMSTAIIVAAVGAHAPRRWRHRRLF